jgi:hypothetical protein
MATITVIRVRGFTPKPDAETITVDPLLSGAGASNVKFLFDFGHPVSPLSVAPLDADTVHDVSENGNGDWDILAGQTLDWSGAVDGVDFSPITTRPAVVLAPASVSAAIEAADQRFLLAFWATLPTQAQWLGGTIAGGAPTGTFMSMVAASDNGYTTQSDLITIGQQYAGAAPSTNQVLAARRQTNGATVDAPLVSLQGTSHFGKPALIAFWRSGSEQVVYLKTSASGSALEGTAAAGSNNVADVSARRVRFGLPNQFGFHPDATNFKLHRGWIETLPAGSARTPRDVLAAEYARNVARFTA